MKLSFLMIDKDFQLHKCVLIAKDKLKIVRIDRYSYGEFPAKTFYINAYGWFFVKNELCCCRHYRRSFKTHIMAMSKNKKCMMVIKLEPPKKEVIDYCWGEICSRKIWEAIELEYIMSWLSTLGGAFSALGDYDYDRASIAGRISLNQLCLAFRIGDPMTTAQCYLYLSISLIQQHKFKAAKRLIKEQYRFALAQHEKSKFLINMCLGIWNKLRYTKQLAQQGRTLRDCVKVPPPAFEHRNGSRVVVETRLG